MWMAKKKITVHDHKITTGDVEVSMRTYSPHTFKRAIVLANGAGANHDSEFIVFFCRRLAESGFLTASFNFPYQEKKRKIPDPKAKLEKCYLDVVESVAHKGPIAARQIIIGGKSMGGRIASQVANQTDAPKLVLLGYPLHPPGKPDDLRDKHLYDIRAELLFVEGGRDPFCESARFEKVRKKLGKHKVFLIPEGDHSFKVPRKTGLDPIAVLEEVVSAVTAFCAEE